MKLMSFLLGILFDEAMDFVNEKTYALKMKLKQSLKRIHSYLITCFILTFTGTISLSAFIIKLGINLDDGHSWSNSLNLYLGISILSYIFLYVIMKKDPRDEYLDFSETSQDSIQDILEEIMSESQINAPPKRQRRRGGGRGRKK